MGGLNHATKFASSGVSKGAVYKAPPSAFTIIDEPGHYLHDPFSPLVPPEWLVRSIVERGVEQPIKIRTDGDRLLVVDGRTRVRAARLACEERERRGEPGIEIAYLLSDGTDERAEESKIIANTQRRAIGWATKSEIAATYRERGYPDEKIADLLAIAPADVERLLAINRCAPKVRREIEDGRVDWHLGETFAELPRDEQTARLDALVASGAKGRTAKNVVRGKKPPEKQQKAGRPSARDLKRTLEALALQDEDTYRLFAAGIRFALGDELAIDDLAQPVRAGIAETIGGEIAKRLKVAA